MAILSTNENLIRSVKTSVLSMYYRVYASNINGVLYAGKDRTAKKMGIDRSTLTRWIQCLIHHGLAERRETGHVVLLPLEQAIRRANGGNKPQHKCTIKVLKKDTRKDIEDMLRVKLLEELHRQAHYVSRETKIMQHTQEKYGNVQDASIRRKLQVKSRKEVEDDGYVELAGKTIAGRMGISERAWYTMSKKMRQEGMISSCIQRQIVHVDGIPVVLSAWQYAKAKDDFGFPTYRKSNGEVIRMLPNKIKLLSGTGAPRVA